MAATDSVSFDDAAPKELEHQWSAMNDLVMGGKCLRGPRTHPPVEKRDTPTWWGESAKPKFPFYMIFHPARSSFWTNDGSLTGSGQKPGRRALPPEQVSVHGSPTWRHSLEYSLFSTAASCRSRSSSVSDAVGSKKQGLPRRLHTFGMESTYPFLW